jgi:hypothetical protein
VDRAARRPALPEKYSQHHEEQREQDAEKAETEHVSPRGAGRNQ